MLNWWNRMRADKPLLLLLLVASVPRLVAVIFSKGYGMHDDHFLIIEAAQSWVDDFDYNHWLPWNQVNPRPTGHSWFYVGINYIFMYVMDFFGIVNVDVKMYIMRFIHGAYSLLAIPPIYYLGRKIGSEKTGFNAALVFAMLWFIPILSVRNLVELVSVPPLLWASWLLVKHDDNLQVKHVLIPGLLMGLAMSVRFHMSLFIGGLGLVLLLRKQWLQAIVFGLAVAFSLFVSQSADLFLWGYPFAETLEYIRYNLDNKTTYFNSPWYQYFGTLAGLMLPPMSVVWMIGYVKNWKKHVLLFWPCLIFFLFHCYFPNKQERFILPVFPFVILLGTLWWEQFVELRKKKWGKTAIWFNRVFWGLNLVLLIVVTPAYSKRSRVEAMKYLGDQDGYFGAVVEYSIEYDVPQSPLFYSRVWRNSLYIGKLRGYSDTLIDRELRLPLKARHTHAIFYEETELDSRMNQFEERFGCKLVYLRKEEPSYLDALLHELNPNNSNETAFIYKIEYPQ